MSSSPSRLRSRARAEVLVGPWRADASPAARRAARLARSESLQRRGKRLIVAGSVITVAGVILYCVASFAGGMGADFGDILFRNAVPFARTTLGVLGLGTLVWLAGSLAYLKGAMDADEGDEGSGIA